MALAGTFQPGIAATKSYHVVVFGDSLTSGFRLQPQDGFPAQLERKIRAAGYDQITVHNLSVPGMTSAAATERVDEVLRLQPDVIIIQLGYNDAKRGVISTAIGHSLNTITHQLKQTGAYVILAGSPAPRGVADAYAHAITQNYYQIAKKLEVVLYPSILAGITDDPSLTLADGIHPNSRGVEMMVEQIFPYVDAGLRWRYEVYLHDQQYSQQPDMPSIPVMP